jgi:hypothetical protein
MIVQRLTVRVKHFFMREWIEVIKAADPHPESTRIYTSRYGPEDVAIWDHEFENVAQIDEYWKEWLSGLDKAEFRQKLEEMIEQNISNEIWNLVE